MYAAPLSHFLFLLLHFFSVLLSDSCIFAGVDGKMVSPSQICKIGVQLYKTTSTTANLNQMYVLDVVKLAGQMFLFLDMVGRIIQDLGATVMH